MPYLFTVVQLFNGKKSRGQSKSMQNSWSLVSEMPFVYRGSWPLFTFNFHDKCLSFIFKLATFISKTYTVESDEVTFSIKFADWWWWRWREFLAFKYCREGIPTKYTQIIFITNKDIECETTDTCKAKIRVAHGSILNQIRYTCYYDIRYFGYSELNLLVPIWL